jgi:adenylosuccinate lyase
MDFFNISPLDNRYYDKVSTLRFFLSDYGINKIRFDTEIAYFKEIVKYIHGYENYDFNLEFSKTAFNRIKEIEKTTNHDIKAIEYYIREQVLEKKEFDYYKYHNLIHFALTSQDINSFTNTLSVKLTVQKIILPKLLNITAILEYFGANWSTVNMMSRTHGQPAVTTSMGKELEVFNSRLSVQIKKLSEYKYTTKFGGAVGNLNAHYYSYPGKHWELFMNNFCNKSELKRNKLTTQIDHYDNLTEVFDIIKRINTILIDLSVDIWMYISINYFKLKTIKTEVGSSTMPHKVNPINFENSEGNLYMANGVFSVFSNKLPISRYQRDLSDSTIARNFGVAFGYSLLAYESLITGLNKLEINRGVIDNDLNENWSILTEAIQCVMKTEGKDNAYEIIKEHARGSSLKFDQNWYLELVNSLDISNENKERLQRLTPAKYF